MSHPFLTPGEWTTSTPPGGVPPKTLSKDSSRDPRSIFQSQRLSEGSSGDTSNAGQPSQAHIASTQGKAYPGFFPKASAYMVPTRQAGFEMGVKLSLHHAGEMRHHYLTDEWYDVSELESMSETALAATTYLEGAKYSYQSMRSEKHGGKEKEYRDAKGKLLESYWDDAWTDSSKPTFPFEHSNRYAAGIWEYGPAVIPQTNHSLVTNVRPDSQTDRQEAGPWLTFRTEPRLKRHITESSTDLGGAIGSIAHKAASLMRGRQDMPSAMPAEEIVRELSKLVTQQQQEEDLVWRRLKTSVEKTFTPQETIKEARDLPPQLVTTMSE